MAFLSERLRPIQWVAVALAFIGVAIELIAFGSIPYISFALACSFGGYGLLRKKVNLDAQTGLFVETLVLLPVALSTGLSGHRVTPRICLITAGI